MYCRHGALRDRPRVDEEPGRNAESIEHRERMLDLLPRHLVLTGPSVADELGIPLKSANAALRDLVTAGVLVEHGTTAVGRGRGRPSRVYTSTELLGLVGATPR